MCSLATLAFEINFSIINVTTFILKKINIEFIQLNIEAK